VIVEGLFALYWEELRRMLDLKVFLDAADALCLERRQLRDVRSRGRTAESVRARFVARVRPMCERWVRPTRRHADLVIDGAEPPERLVAAVLDRIEAGREPPGTGFD
jgi:uridine kinase